MMEDENDVAVKDESAFWTELETIVSPEIHVHEDIDDALRRFLSLIIEYRQIHLHSEYEFARCSYLLLDSRLYGEHRDYVLRQLLYCLLQDEDADTIHLAARACLYDGRNDESTFEMILDEGAFTRLIELVQQKPENDHDLHRTLLELLFEISRIEKLDSDDLVAVNDEFILYLFRLIEALSDDANDPYHYPVIRVLLIFNEQYMAFASRSSSTDNGPVLTNRILKLLSSHGLMYRTFGENLILLLNRESAMSGQLLILKLLYLLFTTSSTQEYFYTNDLHVLVDVIIRNLLNLDTDHFSGSDEGENISQDGQRVLRHTYLRVLCPLLKNTQLSKDGNHYKRDELRKFLHLLTTSSSAHFAPIDETVDRLVARCRNIDWLKDEDEVAQEEQNLAESQPDLKTASSRMLGMNNDVARESSLSVAELPATLARQKPSLPAPRRRGKKSLISVEPGEKMLKIPTATSVSSVTPEKERSPFADGTDDDS